MIAPAPRHALVLAATGDLGFAAGTCLTGFLAHNPGFQGDVMLFHDGLSESDSAALSRLYPRLRPVVLPMSRLTSRLAGAEAPGASTPLPGNLRFSPYILAKFEALDWLTHYDHLIWLDLDVLVRGDLSHLWQITAPLGWRPLPEQGRTRRARQLSALAPHMGQATRSLPNAGVLSFHAAPLRAAGVTAQTLYDLAAAALTKTKTRTPDELALYLLATGRGLEVAELDLADNHAVAQEGSDDARILHAIGPDKFWTATPLLHACPDWAQHHQHWQALGGSPAPEARLYAKVHPASAAAALGYARNRGFWQALWPEIAPQLPEALWPELRAERSFLRLHLRGLPRALHLDILRGPNERRFRLSLGIEKALLDGDATLPEHLATIAAALGLTPHDGRRISAFFTDCALEELISEIHRLTSPLREEPPR